MPKLMNAIDGMTLKDLMSEEGLVLDMADELGEEEADPIAYNRNVHLTNDEVIKFLNMEEFAEEDEDNSHDLGEVMSPWCISFDKIKAKSEDLLGDGKITKLIRQTGVGNDAGYNSLVTVHYGGYFEHQDEPFDSTFAFGAPRKYNIGQGELIWGLDYGISTMKKHETAVFVIHPDYAWGELGCLPLIPESAEVVFIVRVLDVMEGGSDDTITNSNGEARKFKQVRIRAMALIKTAAESVKRNKPRQAIREYNRAAEMLEKVPLENDEEEEEMKRLISRVYGNLAICYNKEDKPRQACKNCLRVPNPTAKTHFHHGRALLKMGEYKKALEQLHISLKMEPGNHATKHEIQLANDLQRRYLQSEKKLWHNCLKLRSGEQEVNEYAQVAKEFCENFVKNDAILRQPLPEGLTPREDKCMRQQAALLGLNVVEHVRYGKEITYLAKTSYTKTLNS
ncbi:inactive peptidyl-prolyl cis-trans isomerase FKBP6 [Venturia canescens]|uniref:inactive peptidyl-prolyl cis-trans isomerase FKBP6 n=1 Tax=Venturia canescens TaxID=32260 RepID=UPI001C9C7925|nr:inactive peptidyl-prolyl cis-trans isomerase FKBP6 [Venturia canescens]XP_043267446.1 inactive peptidyl-prolyl cis-trans isomerase FKBP6 [Venturia canescens]